MNWEGFIVILGQSISYPAFWVGFVLVALFAHGRFAASEAESEVEDPRVVSRSFTTRFRYGLSAIAYIITFEFFFGVFVGIGSLPFLQGLLTEWIGGLDIPSNGEAQIGTPAWAAMFVTAVLPSAPGFAPVDKRFRKNLHNFASIPYKARGLAREILDHLNPEFLHQLNPDSAHKATDENTRAKHEAAQLSWLFDAIAKLQDSGETGNKADKYRRFFQMDYQKIWTAMQQKHANMGDWIYTPESESPVVAGERAALLKTTARFFSCALLLNEPSERSARGRIRDQLGMAHLPILLFDFKLEQIIISILLGLLLTFCGAIVALGLALPGGWSDIHPKMVATIGFWLPFTAVTMAVPFIFAAGVRLYFMDRKQFESKILFEDQLLAVILLFIFTYGVSMIPTLMGLLGGKYNLNQNWILQVAPAGLTPAVVALLFYFLSCRRLVKSLWKDTALDILFFSVVAAVMSWATMKVAIGAGLNISQMMNVDGLTNDVVLVVSPVTHAVLVGVIGAIQCSISRATLKPDDAPEPEMTAQVSLT